VTAGLLPPPLREGYGLTWTGCDRRLHEALCGASRRARMSPLWELPVARMR